MPSPIEKFLEEVTLRHGREASAPVVKDALAEIRSHLEESAGELQGIGRTREEAEIEAVKRFGLAKTVTKDLERVPWWSFKGGWWVFAYCALAAPLVDFFNSDGLLRITIPFVIIDQTTLGGLVFGFVAVVLGAKRNPAIPAFIGSLLILPITVFLLSTVPTTPAGEAFYPNEYESVSVKGPQANLESADKIEKLFKSYRELGSYEALCRADAQYCGSPMLSPPFEGYGYPIDPKGTHFFYGRSAHANAQAWKWLDERVDDLVSKRRNLAVELPRKFNLAVSTPYGSRVEAYANKMLGPVYLVSSFQSSAFFAGIAFVLAFFKSLFNKYKRPKHPKAA